MYIWTGIDIDAQLAGVREKVRRLEREQKVKNSNLTLPFHISLKMSFPVEKDRTDAVTECLEQYYRSLSPFEIPVAGIEYHSTITWIRMKENESLNRIHDSLNELLLSRFGVGLHEYDRDYLFHTTLAMDNDAAMVRRMYEALKDEPLPAVLLAKHFLIGASENGALGTYKVTKRIVLQKESLSDPVGKR